MDRRRLPFDGTTALSSLDGQVPAQIFTRGEPASVTAPISDLMRQPDSGLDKVLVFGEPVTIVSQNASTSFIQSELDGYCGYTPTSSLGPRVEPTHRVTARSTHVYTAADFKSPVRFSLSFGSLLAIAETSGRFLRIAQGWVPIEHATPIARPGADPVTYAERFLGTPYLWGGNTGFGIDCSGLVQAAHLACGISCPRDSDMQEAEMGALVPEGAPLRRGDLVFWKGHVGILRDATTLLHANAHHMMTVAEPLAIAIARIGKNEFGEVTAIKRL